MCCVLLVSVGCLLLLFVVCGMLCDVVRCVLFVVCCLLFVVLLAVACWMLSVIVRCSLFAAVCRCVLRVVVRGVLFVVCRFSVCCFVVC